MLNPTSSEPSSSLPTLSTSRLPPPPPRRAQAVPSFSTTPVETEDPLARGLSRLTEYQETIFSESLSKGSGGAHLPMGTGKTLIYTLVALQQARTYAQGKILIVAAKSLLPTWKEEIEKHFGETLSFEIFHKEYIKNLGTWTPQSDFILTTPEVLSKCYTKYNLLTMFSYVRRPLQFGPEIRYYNVPNTPYLRYTAGDGIFHATSWAVVVVDEAHQYFNPSSARCLAIAALSAQHRWLLSGTLLAETKPEKLLGYHLMVNHPTAPRNLPELKKYVSGDGYEGIQHSLVKREGNQDFIPPNVQKVIVSHPLTPTEALIYTNVKQLLEVLRRQLKAFEARGDTINVRKFYSYIMGMISYLRQCLVCPLIPITTVALDVVDFEQRSELSEMFMTHIRSLGIDAWLNDLNSIYSSRLRAVCEKINDHPEESITVFSCYRTVINVLRLYLPSDRPIFTIKGSDKVETRAQVINQFRASGNGILLLTYDIGATGINLQCSSVACLLDFFWNAGKSEQAVARLLRPGQTASVVTLYYFTANTGMEHALFQMQQSKLARGREILTGKITTNIAKVKIADILRLLQQQDNIEILDHIVRT